ncbi:hypothetical protein BT93_H0041 [Corymbia citriodora subsp. variegata]|nr:hypothetical protein BT93_H0041 [Corymbia citriodora subsp. variegata]
MNLFRDETEEDAEILHWDEEKVMQNKCTQNYLSTKPTVHHSSGRSNGQKFDFKLDSPSYSHL